MSSSICTNKPLFLCNPVRNTAPSPGGAMFTIVPGSIYCNVIKKCNKNIKPYVLNLPMYLKQLLTMKQEATDRCFGLKNPDVLKIC
jgi:hypothetical protein